MANAQYFQWPADSRQRSASLVCVKTKTSNEWRVTIGHRTPPCALRPVHCVLSWWKLRESAGDQHNALLSLMGNVDVVLAAVPGWAAVAVLVLLRKMCGNPLNTWGRLYFGGSKLVLLHITFWITQNHLVYNWAWGLQSMFLNDR